MFRVKSLPVLSTVPRSGTWFLRYAISFLCHLDRGGRIDDRLSGEIFGDRAGTPFDFQHFRGGPLFRAKGTMPSDLLFIGHTVCPGFADVAAEYEWWPRTDFHVPGYDYLHEGFNYRYTPVELATDHYTPIYIKAVERSPWTRRGQRMALVYRNPLDQASSYFRYCQGHVNPTYNTFRGRPLTEVPFHTYLFESALPSYAKQFLSFQVMAERRPESVKLVPYECLMEKPEETLANLLGHLSESPGSEWANLHNAVHLARSEHLRAIEAELGRSLDGTRMGRRSHMRRTLSRGKFDETMRDEVIDRLQSMGIDTDLIVWPAADDFGSLSREQQIVAAE